MALFTREFVDAISRLRIVSRHVPRGGNHAEQLSVQLGGGMEFRDFRSYAPGDDFRHIDWNLFRRSGKLFLRLFEETRDVPVHILLDVSDSMFFEDRPRADVARQFAAAMVAAALNQHDRPQIHPFSDSLLPPLPVTRGAGSLARALAYLENLGPAGPTDVARALHGFARGSRRRGLVVVISDFFDGAGVESVLAALGRIRHRLLLAQVVRPGDAEPDISGQVRLVDCETGQDVNVSATPDALRRYRQAYGQFREAMATFVTRRRAGHVALDADGDILEQLSEVFVGGTFLTQG